MDKEVYVVRLGLDHSGRCDLFGPFADDVLAWDWAEDNFRMDGSQGEIMVRRANTACQVLGIQAPT